MRKFGVSNESGQTILLVEENDCLRTLIRDYLEANGFEVKDAANAAEALRLAGIWGHQEPDLLLTGARLSDASGSWMAGKLRSVSRSRMAVVYLVDEELDMETLGGSDFHVQKPFSFIQLHTAVEEALMEVESKEAGLNPSAWGTKGGATPSSWGTKGIF